MARIGAYEWPVRLTPTMEVLLATVADLAGTEVTPDNVDDLVEEFGGAARMIGAVISNTLQPTMLQAGYKVNVVPDRGHAPTSTVGSCPATRTSSWRPSRSWSARASPSKR